MSHTNWWSIHIGIGQIIIYAVPFLLLGEHLREVQSIGTPSVFNVVRPILARSYRYLLIVTLIGASLLVGRILWRTVVAPPGWDYEALWLYGHVADSGQNPYLPGPYPGLAGPGPFIVDFREEVLEVGSTYPPPTLLLFAPIGLLPMRVAIVPWMILQTAAFVGLVVLLWRTFLPGRGKEGLALMFTLSLLLPGTIATFGHGQVNFLAVLCVLFAWRTQNRAVSGVYLAGAAVLKLLYGALWLYPVLRWRWRSLLGVAVSSVGSVLASIAVFDWTVFATYVKDNPVVHRMPSHYFMREVNQSLLGASLRLVPYHMPAFGPPTHDPLYLITAAITGLITVLLVVRLPRTLDGDAASFNLLILAGMLIYPWTLSNYFVLLLVPMGFLWMQRTKSPIGTGWTIFLLSAVYPITYIYNGLYSIVATILLWIAFCVISVHAILASSRGMKTETADQNVSVSA